MAGRRTKIKNENLTLYEIRTTGCDALVRKLGPSGAIRFIQQYESGHGDYTRNRKKLLPKRSVGEIGREIVKRRQSKTKWKKTLVYRREPSLSLFK